LEEVSNSDIKLSSKVDESPILKLVPNEKEVIPRKREDDKVVVDNKLNDKQSEVKLLKIGNVQVRETFNLNDVEKRMIESIKTSPNRGHIFQIYNGNKIMDFHIDTPNQMTHIERQLNNFSSSRGKYIIYVIWETDLKYKVLLSQKLRYNPNVRYK